MSDYIDTREGWREVDSNLIDWGGDPMKVRIGTTERYWVREAPVPPLPTAPGYYLAVDGSVYRLDTDGEGPIWDDTFGNRQDESDLVRVLPLKRLEPRAVTAKTVIERVQQLSVDSRGERAWSVVALEFGVES